MKTIPASVVVVAFSVLSGCAGTAVTQRGTVVSRGESIRAFAAGPAEVHAFSMERGGKVFTAVAASGTDADCAQASARTETPIASDRVKVVTLASGQVACLSTPGERNYELLWHARTAPATEPTTATVAHNQQ